MSIKWVYRIIAGLAIAAVLYVLFPNGDPNPRPTWWNIQSGSDTLTVLGLSLNKSKLSDAIHALKVRPKVALFTRRQGENQPEPPMHLEAYFEDIFDEGDNIIVTLLADKKLLQHIKKEAYQPEWMPNDVIRVGIRQKLYPNLQDLIISSITILAGRQIEFEAFQKHFGKPGQILSDRQGNAHFLYPQLGLDLIQPAGGTHILQFVSPDVFDQELLQPLVNNQHK
jgi:hypothetical protein